MSINLSKGEKISLSKSGGSQLTRIRMGLGWKPADNTFFGFGGSVDLDASAVMMDDNNRAVDTVWFRKLRSSDGSVFHSGDNRTGDGDGDDETISVDLTRVPTNVKRIVFTVNSYTGQSFSEVKECHARLVDDANGTEIFKYNPSEQGNHTGMIMCSIYRHNGEWKAAAHGVPSIGETVQDLLTEIQRIL